MKCLWRRIHGRWDQYPAYIFWCKNRSKKPFLVILVSTWYNQGLHYPISYINYKINQKPPYPSCRPTSQTQVSHWLKGKSWKICRTWSWTLLGASARLLPGLGACLSQQGWHRIWWIWPVISWRFFSVYKNHVVFSSIPRNSWLGGYNIEFNSLKFGCLVLNVTRHVVQCSSTGNKFWARPLRGGLAQQ